MQKNKDLKITDVAINHTYEKIIDGISQQHWAVIDDFLTPDLVSNLKANLKEKREEDELKKAAIGNRTNELVARSIRGDFIQWIDDKNLSKAEALFFEEINSLVYYLNRTCFMGILHKEFHYALYPKDTFYKRHLDTFQNDDRRVLSMVFYLNNEGWDEENGGELVIYQKAENSKEAIHILPKPGRLVIFESQILEHEVLPILAGERYSITGWLKTR